MYETEANHLIESSNQIPWEGWQAFEQLSGRILSRTVLPWSEHCTECVWPTCYTTCDLYAPRQDGRCRRFHDGMVRIESPSAVNSYILKIRFKQWGKLWTPGNIRLRPAEKAAQLERRDHRIGSLLQASPLPSLVKIAVTKKRYGFKKRVADSAPVGEELPTCFLLECFNPLMQEVSLSLTMRATDQASNIPFQKLIHLTPGYHSVRVPLEEISRFIDLREPFGIELIPNQESDETTLYFGLMDFVTEAAESKANGKGSDQDSSGKSQNQKKIKCVVWDLDNTLWDGVLLEDGPDRLRLKAGVKEAIETLDRRGILHSIASKNNPEEAMQVIRKFNLEPYFLCPQISWQPKSESLRAVAQQLNIGLDSLLFVDDSTFELEEVRAACPEVKLLNAEFSSGLCDREDCQVPVTAESQERRKLYQVEAGRQAVAQNFSHDYMAFLRHCEIELTVRPMSEENLERVHELTQRTNQMNFSGNRYDREVLRQLLASPDLDTFVLSCQDRFGSYGVVGFSVVDRREPRMIDLMFSCRIQSKRVEHAFLAWLIRKYIAESGNDFYADYRKTPRNAPSGKVFADLGMEEHANTKDGVLSLRFSRLKDVPEDGVIGIALLDGKQDVVHAALQETSA
jgi:FkbH-like protein